MTTPDERRGALDAVERIVNRGGDADDVLREVVAVLGRLYPYAAIRFVEEGDLVEGPRTGESGAETARFPIAFQGTRVAELEAAETAEDDHEFLERVATLISSHCLVGWDTRGQPWEP